jgi:hypothetical protein
MQFMSKEFLNSKILRMAVAGAALITATPHFEVSAQVNGIKIIDCETPERPKSNTANLPILPDQVLVIGDAPRQLLLKGKEEGVSVSRLIEGKEEEFFPFLLEKYQEEISLRGETITFRPKGQGTSIDVAVKRETGNTFRANIEASCYEPPKRERE